MKHNVFLAAVGSAMVVGLVSTSASASTGHVKKIDAPVACVKQDDTTSKAVSHNDLAGTGLVFDPQLPGGARPEDQSEGQPQTTVDPTTVQLFPSASPTNQTTTGKKEDHATDDCP